MQALLPYTDNNMALLCLDDYEKKAIEKLSDKARKFYIGGADEEVTLRDNVDGFRRIRLRPRMLKGVTEVDLTTTVLGQKISMPICVAPSAFHELAHPDAEVGTATGCAKSKTLITISSYASSSIKKIVNKSLSGPRWLQLYVLKNKTHFRSLIREAEEAGFTALVLTIDLPITGQRRATVDPDFFKGLSIPMITRTENGKLECHSDDVIVKKLTWDMIPWIKSFTKLPLIVKGLLTAEDAEVALQYGVDGIIVSNHGGRQLDGVLATIDALPEVVKAVNGQVEVYMDGGVRLGTDVLKALALGARAVFIGRPAIYGLAVEGSKGVHKVLEILRKELKTAMVLSGCTSLSDIPASLVTRQCQCRL